MRDPIILLVHLIATLARLMGPGGTVKLTETRLTNPQVMGSSPIANRACWNYLSPILSNLTTQHHPSSAAPPTSTLPVRAPYYLTTSIARLIIFNHMVE